jgi:hypothetical protein
VRELEQRTCRCEMCVVAGGWVLLKYTPPFFFSREATKQSPSPLAHTFDLKSKSTKNKCASASTLSTTLSSLNKQGPKHPGTSSHMYIHKMFVTLIAGFGLFI